MNSVAPKLILSTVGTSILTNTLTKEERDARWYSRLASAANMTLQELEKENIEVKLKIDDLARRASCELTSADITKRRRLGAELNGIYGIYKCVIHKTAAQDRHCLVGTDTYQGRVAINVLKEFLQKEGLNVIEVIPKKLSTRSTKDFSEGIRDLMAWCSRELSVYKEAGYRVIFNLVGGFKALQGYMNTLGMFYADRIEYIFEGPDSYMISIPNLPIEFKWGALEPYAVWLAMMEQGYVCPTKHLQNISKVFIEHDTNDAMLSRWGELAWSNIKSDILSKELLKFPWLGYSEEFRRDFKGADPPVRVQLQEKLAKVAKLLEEANGDLQVLKEDGGLQYENYKGVGDGLLGHFRISQDLRVSCRKKENGILYLYRFGSHDYVEKNL